MLPSDMRSGLEIDFYKSYSCCIETDCSSGSFEEKYILKFRSYRLSLFIWRIEAKFELEIGKLFIGVRTKLMSR